MNSLLRKHVVSSPKFDFAWFSADQLRRIEGEHRWIKSLFSSDELQPDDDEQIPRNWRVQVEGGDPDQLLNLLRGTRYEASAALTAVGSVLRGDGGRRAEVAADYQGGFVSSGSSFDLVAGLLWRTLDLYESYVLGLEARFQLRTTPVGSANDGDLALTFEGEVALIDFPQQVADVDAFADNLFNCREPFRLWAVPRRLNETEWEANAVDLHVGHPLRLEISPHRMRVLLGEHTCGNTLARLLANLQHRFHAQSALTDVAV